MSAAGIRNPGGTHTLSKSVGNRLDRQRPVRQDHKLPVVEYHGRKNNSLGSAVVVEALSSSGNRECQESQTADHGLVMLVQQYKNATIRHTRTMTMITMYFWEKEFSAKSSSLLK